MSLLNEFKQFLEDNFIYNVYVEYDNTPLSDRGNTFITIGINSDEFSYDIKNNSTDLTKNKISFKVTLIMAKHISSNFIEGYFDNNIVSALMKSNTFNVISVQKNRPTYTKYLDRMELSSNIVVECISKFN